MAKQVTDRINENNNRELNTSEYFSYDVAIGYQNVRGLRTKTQELWVAASENNYDIICLTETWLISSILNTEIFPNNYCVFRADRELEFTGKTRGGGALIAVNTNFKTTPVFTYTQEFEFILVKIQIKHRSYFVGVVYIAPNSNLEIYSSFFEMVESLISPGNEKPICILGDFNIREVNENLTNSTPSLIQLKNFMNIMNLKSINRIENKFGNTLDLILVSENETLRVFREFHPLLPEDDYHPSLCVTIQGTREHQKLGREQGNRYRNYNRANFKLLYESLEKCNWSILETKENVNEALDFFYKKFNEILDYCVPMTTWSKRNYPTWYTKEIICIIKRKEYHMKRRHFSEINNGEFKDLRALLKKKIRLAYDEYIKQVESSISTNSKTFWSFIKQKKSNNQESHCYKLNDIALTTKVEIAEAFADHFKSTFLEQTGEANAPSLQEDLINDLDMLDISHVTVQEVLDAIKRLKSKRSAGPDGIPQYVVKGCGDVIAYPISIIINKSLKQKTFPEAWKIARVCPVFKNGDNGNIKNYRPVSILSILSKVFEDVLHKKIYHHVEKIVLPQQHGFMRGRSTTSNLINFINYTSTVMDKGGQVDVIYTDMTKAFDKIDHTKLINKLKTFCLSDNLVSFFETYLKNRFQYVHFRGVCSEPYRVTSGINQGSKLGPLLFLLFINDAGSVLKKSEFQFYADDIKLYKEVSCQADSEILQSDLNSLVEWGKCNALEFNGEKCESMTISRKKCPVNYIYRINDKQLKQVVQKNDLGVIVDCKLTFNAHREKIINRGYRNLGFVMRNTKQFKNIKAVTQVYYSLVRSVLEYAAIVWSPSTKQYTKEIENVQAKFLRYLYFFVSKSSAKYVSYRDLIKNFGVDELELRRNITALRYFHRILNGKTDNKELLQDINIYVPAVNNRSQILFYIKKCNTKHHSNSPLNRMCQMVNRIPSADIFGKEKSFLETMHSKLAHELY